MNKYSVVCPYKWLLLIHANDNSQANGTKCIMLCCIFYDSIYIIFYKPISACLALSEERD